VSDRENLRFLRTRIFGLVREIFTRLGQHMAEAGAIDSADHVFWLTQQEAWGWVRGTTIAPKFQQLVALRRDQYAEFATQPELADRFHTWGPIWRRNEFLGRPQPSADADLAGLAAFPGVVEGVVRVVHDPRDEPPLEGAILVTYRTDPGWVPLFPQASGILVERGSLLSHSAVVAREMGIPTIVGIGGLVARLKSGDRVRMDAGAGSVEILESEE
jgi:pyruvate,water dikinase